MKTNKPWKIVQYYGWSYDGKPLIPKLDNITIKKFKTWLGAYLYRWWNHDWADPAWQMSFIWKIEQDN